MSNILLIFTIIIISLLLSEVLRRYLVKLSFLDEPNQRSSHIIPIPRGGGLAFTITFLASIGFIDIINPNIILAFVGSAILVAGIGFWDDYDHIPAKWRLLAHFLASVWAVYFIGGMSQIYFLTNLFNAWWIEFLFVSIIIVWLINLFNFMDGIDGIAASEAIFVSCGAALFFWLYEVNSFTFISLTLSASIAGFLFLNWPPAKIFMGDVGSGFLGLVIGIIAYAGIIEGISIWIWVILLGVFLVDSGITLLIRILNGDKWYEAHCSHAYQHAAKKWGHKRVTVFTLLINLGWLFPIAYLIHLNENKALLLTFIAYLPLIVIALKFKAGIAANNE